MNSILEEINKENIERFGPIHSCGMFEKFCRCFVSEYLKNNHHEGGLPVELVEPLRKKYKEQEK
jgi:hypothetical protein